MNIREGEGIIFAHHTKYGDWILDPDTIYMVLGWYGAGHTEVDVDNGDRPVTMGGNMIPAKK